MERDRIFLVYLSRTYKNMRPYLKGIHQTLYSWREGRDEDYSKLTRQKLITESVESLKSFDKEARSVVKLASRLKDDLFALEYLL